MPGKGPLGGMHAAFLAAAYAYCWVVGCDMPFLSPEAALLMLSRIAEHDAVVPVIKGKLHPLHGVYAAQCAGTIIEVADFYYSQMFCNSLLSSCG
jgi:molybdopterin-guanine dinucleotide biosynthesis protein A